MSMDQDVPGTLIVILAIAFIFIVFMIKDFWSLSNKKKENSVAGHTENTEKPGPGVYTPDRVNPVVAGTDFERQKIMTEHEKKFFALLQENIPGDCRIFAQVALNQLVKVRDITNTKRKGKNIARIENKSVDFVICDDQNNIVFAIELDDRSHDDPERQINDSEKTFALDNAGIRLKRFRGIPGGEKIQELFENLDAGGNEIKPGLHKSVRTDSRDTSYDRHSLLGYNYNPLFGPKLPAGYNSAADAVGYNLEGIVK